MDFSTINTTVTNPGTTTSPDGTTTTASQTLAQQAQNTQTTFLQLLVAQMNNQDPTNPMDNSQLTTQLAQIQTVEGLSGLSDSVNSLSAQFTQMQALQGVSLVGHDVYVQGNNVTMNSAGGSGTGTFNLSGAATDVKVKIMTSAGVTVDTVDLGAMSAGQQTFNWTNANYGADADLTYSVTAVSGGSSVPATTYSEDKVVAVNTSGTTLQLQLANLGTVPYSSVQFVD